MQDTVLEVKNLTKKFGSFTAVNNISFSLKEGEILGLLGPNGAGKTTTIQMLFGIMDPTVGSISYFGKNFHKHREEILKQINFASTYISLPGRFSVNEILHIFARLYEVQDREKRVKKLLQTFALDHLAKKEYNQLSAGEKTRLVITKSFLNYPRVILLDEPTASLDPEIAQRVRDFLLKEKKEYDTTILLTSHNMSEVEEMCDDVIVINHGKIVEHGSPEKLIQKISTCTLELAIGGHAKKATTLLEEKLIPFTMNRNRFMITVDEKKVASFLSLLADEKINYEEISIRKPDLEDFFIQVIGGAIDEN